MRRVMDENGRIELPRSIAEDLGIRPGDELEVWLDDQGQILIKGESPRCTFCGEKDAERLISYRGRFFCQSCRQQLEQLVNEER